MEIMHRNTSTCIMFSLPGIPSSGGKAAGAWSWQLTSSRAEVKNMWSYTSIPHTPSRRGA